MKISEFSGSHLVTRVQLFRSAGAGFRRKIVADETTRRKYKIEIVIIITLLNSTYTRLQS